MLARFFVRFRVRIVGKAWLLVRTTACHMLGCCVTIDPKARPLTAENSGTRAPGHWTPAPLLPQPGSRSGTYSLLSSVTSARHKAFSGGNLQRRRLPGYADVTRDDGCSKRAPSVRHWRRRVGWRKLHTEARDEIAADLHLTAASRLPASLHLLGSVAARQYFPPSRGHQRASWSRPLLLCFEIRPTSVLHNWPHTIHTPSKQPHESRPRSQ